jgi:glutamyl-tRNA reductase
MNSRPFVVSGVRLTHDRASLETLEAASYPDWRERVATLADRADVAEAVVLQTCNRIEEYVVAETAAAGRAALADFAPDAPAEAVVETDHEESLRHLLRVAAGLESQVLGEDQILGQIRTAYAEARELDAVGPVLEDALLKAVHVGERARSETEINEGTVSLGRAAVEFVRRERAGGLDGAAVLVVGAGEMAGTVLAALGDDDGPAAIRLVNRSPDRARTLVEGHARDVAVASLDGLGAALAEADVVFSATGSHEPVVTDALAADAGPTFVVDLAQPGDVADPVAAVEGVAVHDLDALRSITERTHAERREAAAAVEELVASEHERLLETYKRKRADAVIAAMYKGAERLKAAELARAESRLAAAGDDDGDGVSDAEREVLDDFADALVSRLLAVPTRSLREAAVEDDWTTISTALELFDPTMEEEWRYERFAAAVAGGDGDGDDAAASPDAAGGDRPPER